MKKKTTGSAEPWDSKPEFGKRNRYGTLDLPKHLKEMVNEVHLKEAVNLNNNS